MIESFAGCEFSCNGVKTAIGFRIVAPATRDATEELYVLREQGLNPFNHYDFCQAYRSITIRVATLFKTAMENMKSGNSTGRDKVSGADTVCTQTPSFGMSASSALRWKNALSRRQQ
jgi:hypothetical protein